MSNRRKSSSKTNQPIGTIFTYRNVKLKVKHNPTGDCIKCYFNNRKHCLRTNCCAFERVDNKNVYFKQIPA